MIEVFILPYQKHLPSPSVIIIINIIIIIITIIFITSTIVITSTVIIITPIVNIIDSFNIDNENKQIMYTVKNSYF